MVAAICRAVAISSALWVVGEIEGPVLVARLTSRGLVVLGWALEALRPCPLVAANTRAA